MPDFYYEGVSREGEKIKGQIFADNEVDLRIKLRSQKIRPVKIKEQLYAKKQVITLPAKTDQIFSDEERLFFVKELLVMFKAGLTITQSLDVLTSEGSTQTMRDLASTLKNYMESGMTFSQALSRFPKYFDNLFLNLTASGELRGNLEYILGEWLEYFKKEQEVKRVVKKTILYPLAIISIILAAFAIIVVGIAPVFVYIYRTYNQQMPLTLLTIATLGGIIRENLIFLTLLLAGSALGIFFLLKNKLAKLSIDGLLLRTPWLSYFFKEVYTLRTLLTLNIALKSGLSLSRSLELASEKIDNHIFEECLLKAREAADKHEPITPFLIRSGLFRPMILQVFSIGEIMGSLPDMLEEMISYLSEEIKRLSTIFASIIEPVILILGGVLIGALLTSFFVPMFSILSKIK
ncbi:MAG: type II secretion system F family protein [bacterium]